MNARYIEAFTVCVNYNDFLDIILPLNKKHFDKWLIVTTPEDIITKQICQKHNVQFVECNRMYENGDKFNKGKALNDVLHYLTKQDWLLHIDADIILPGNFRETIDNLDLDPEFLYGSKRKEFDKDYPYKVPFPYGYLQIFSKQSEALRHKNNIFPENYTNAGYYDVEFINYWKEKTKMLDIEVLHIPHGTQTNWNGRKSVTISDDLATYYSHAGRKIGKQQPLCL